MLINDELLSAFLDNELSAEDTEQVREYIATDDAAAARLAQLAMVDQRVRNQVDQLSATPIPRAVLDLLDDQPVTAATNVTPLSAATGFKHRVQQHLALAASVALVVGFGFGYAFNGSPTDTLQNNIAAVLEQQPSGMGIPIENGATVTPQLTFTSTAGDFCRQYQLHDPQSQRAEVAIQCRTDGQWQQVAMAQIAYTDSSEYRTASGNHALDSVLDQMMATAPLSADEEAARIQAAWQSSLRRTQTEEQ